MGSGGSGTDPSGHERATSDRSGQDLEFRILGPLEVWRAGSLIELRTPKLRDLLVVLLLEPDRAVSVDRLVDALWGETPPASAAATLQCYVCKLRSALGADVLRTRPSAYALAVNPDAIDARRFERLVAEGRVATEAGDPRRALERLTEATVLWRGAALEDVRLDAFARPDITRLEEARLAAEEDRADAELALGQHAEVAGRLSALAREHPLRERLWEQLMVALYRCGRQAEALRSYTELRSHLAELGLDPSARLRATEEAILVQKVELDWHSDRPPVQASPGPSVAVPRAVDRSPLCLGREREIAMVLAGLQRDSPQAFLVSSPPGGGKSLFLAELERRAAAPVLRAGAYEPEQDEPWSLARALLARAVALRPTALDALAPQGLQALAALLPAQLTQASPGAPLDGESWRAVAFEGAVRVLATGARGALVLVDDAQWGDSTSLKLLASLARREPALTLVVAYRPDALTPGSHLAQLVNDLSTLSSEPVDLPLGSLCREDVAAVFAERDVADALWTGTGGSPVAIAEVVQGLLDRGAITPTACGQWRATTSDAGDAATELAALGRRRAILARLGGISNARREVLELLTLFGRETPSRVLAAVLEARATTVLDDLEALCTLGLVRHGQRGWSATDTAIQVVAHELDAASRARLHQLIADTLEHEGGDAAEVARHLVGAGDQLAGARFYAAAARQRLTEFASDEAVALVEAGLGLESTSAVRQGLIEVRASARELSGDRRGAREDLRRLLNALPSGPERARLLARLALLTTSVDPAEAAEMADVAVTQAGPDRRARAEALAVGAIVDGNNNHAQRSAERSAAAIALFRELGDANGIASALDANANNLLYDGHVRRAAGALEQVARLYGHAGSLLRVGTPLSLAAWCLMLSGRPHEGLDRAKEALDLERMLGQREGEAACLWVLSEVLLALGRDDDALTAGTQALESNARVDSRAGLALSRCAAARAYARSGDDVRARDLLEQALAESEGIMEHAFAAGRLATFAKARGDVATARSAVELCLDGHAELARYEGRLVAAELAVEDGAVDAREEGSQLVARLEAEGYCCSEALGRLKIALRRAASPRVVRGRSRLRLVTDGEPFRG